MRATSLDLADVSSPAEFSEVLRAAAQDFRESDAELCAAWQNDTAGRIWRKFASILEHAAAKADKAAERHAY
jgi:hypothetical protein